MNINPKIWGRSVWDFFYYVALSYPKNPTPSDKAKFKQFYKIAGSIVPCQKCQINFMTHIQELPIENYLNSSYDLFEWVTNMDNKVRSLNNAKQLNVSETMEYYMNNIQEYNNGINFTNKQTILISLGIGLLLLFLIKKIKL